jgi:hypothetical protein
MHALRQHVRRLLPVYAAALVALGLVAAWLVFSRDRSHERAESRSHPVSDAERLVLRKLDHHFPHSVPLRWGPQAYGAELEEIPAWTKDNPDSLIRVRIRLVNGTEVDLVYGVTGDHVVYLGTNPHGDEWKAMAKKGQVPYNPPYMRMQEGLEGK